MSFIEIMHTYFRGEKLEALRSPLGSGLGVALILVSAIGLLVDGFAERRAEPYTAALEQIAATQSALPRSK